MLNSFTLSESSTDSTNPACIFYVIGLVESNMSYFVNHIKRGNVKNSTYGELQINSTGSSDSNSLRSPLNSNVKKVLHSPPGTNISENKSLDGIPQNFHTLQCTDELSFGPGVNQEWINH